MVVEKAINIFKSHLLRPFIPLLLILVSKFHNEFMVNHGIYHIRNIYKGKLEKRHQLHTEDGNRYDLCTPLHLIHLLLNTSGSTHDSVR